ncbi:hypothetical protein [Paenibacillus sp. QZ-Y1]|uniref:hypothetical protein n=1 Tax=Paenibacillus sp. QZ-Y1 TaxID=3414511 RepID=UPI003F7A446D
MTITINKPNNTGDLIKKAMTDFDFTFNSLKPDHVFEVGMIALHKFSHGLRVDTYLIKEAEFILTTHEDRRNFVNRVSKLNRNDAASTREVERILFEIRARKQREYPVNKDELRYAVANQDVDMLNKLFMTAEDLSFWFGSLDKSKFVNRYFDAVNASDEYVSFTDVYRD